MAVGLGGWALGPAALAVCPCSSLYSSLGPGRWPGAPDISSIWNPTEGVVFTTVPHDDAPGQLAFS